MNDIFQVVLQTSLYATVVGLLILLLKGMLKNRLNARWHYLIWAVLIVKLLLPFGPESAFSLFNVMPKMPQTSIAEVYYAMEGEYEASIGADDPLPYAAPTREQIKAVEFAALLEYLAPYIWAGGAGLLLLWLLGTYYFLHRKLRRGVLTGDERIWRVFKSSKTKMGVHRNIRLVLQDAVPTPALFGTIRPKILLPKTILNFSDKELEYILLHELAHYKRQDVLVNYLLLVFQVIHWFNPVMWYCFKRIRQDMEVATDERVLSSLENTEHKDYGKALLAVLEGFIAPSLAPKLLGMVDDKKNIDRRITMIKMAEFYKSQRRMVLGIGLACLVLLGSVLLTNGQSKDNISKVSTKYNAEALLKYQTAYVGDNSKVVNLINNLAFADLRREVSLQTRQTPYGITVNYDFSTVNMDADTNQIESTFRSNAAIMFALIDNVDTIVFQVGGTGELTQSQDNQRYQYTRAEIQQNFDQDLREYSQDVQTFEDFLYIVQRSDALANGMNIKILVFPEKYALLMSSTPGIRILAESTGVVGKVRYSAETGGLFTWEVASGKISEAAQSLELPSGIPAYWGPATPGPGDEVTKAMDNKVNITLLDQQGQIIGEKLIHIQFDGSMYYTVQSSLEVLIGVASSQQSLEEAVSQAIKGRRGAYYSGELTTEGHLILQTEENNNNDTVKVYVLASVSNFGFENNIFTKVSGSGAIPTLIIFSKDNKGEYALMEYKVPLDGANYTKSIQEMFPSSLLNKVQNSHLYYQDLVKQQEEQAHAYLLSQGRNAPINGNRVEKQYPTNLSDKASGDLDYKFKYGLMGGYPRYLGTREVVENGIRYIYEFKQELRQNDSLLIFTKYKVDGTIVEKREYTANDIGLVEAGKD